MIIKAVPPVKVVLVSALKEKDLLVLREETLEDRLKITPKQGNHQQDRLLQVIVEHQDLLAFSTFRIQRLKLFCTIKLLEKVYKRLLLMTLPCQRKN